MKRIAFALLLALPLLAQNPKSAQKSPAPTKNAATIDFVKIQPGDFMMGCATGDATCDADEKPAHHVQITKGFEIGKYEVTQAQWQAVMGANPSTIKGDDRPVETVSKQDAQDFLAKLTARNDGYRYRLPTEAEWEYAARAGAPLPTSLDEVAWYAANSDDETHPVGQKKPNAWGLYDTLGNVREWVADQYGRDYYASSPAADPTGPLPGQGGQQRGNFGRGRRFNNGGRNGGGPNNGGPNNGAPNNNNGAPNNNGAQPNAAPIAYQRIGYQPVAYQAGAPQDGQGAGQGGAPQGQQGNQGGAGGGPGGGQGGGQGGNYGRRNFGGRGNFGAGGPGGPGGPCGPGGRDRQLPILRGGAWDNPATFVRLSARYHYYGPTLKLSDVGFRAVREPIQPDGGK